MPFLLIISLKGGKVPIKATSVPDDILQYGILIFWGLNRTAYLQVTLILFSVYFLVKISSVLIIHCTETKKKPYPFWLTVINSAMETSQPTAFRCFYICWSIGIRKKCKFKKLQSLKSPLPFFPLLKNIQIKKNMWVTHILECNLYLFNIMDATLLRKYKDPRNHYV